MDLLNETYTFKLVFQKVDIGSSRFFRKSFRLRFKGRLRVKMIHHKGIGIKERLRHNNGRNLGIYEDCYTYVRMYACII